MDGVRLLFLFSFIFSFSNFLLINLINIFSVVVSRSRFHCLTYCGACPPTRSLLTVPQTLQLSTDRGTMN